jgi:hypothetical protein
MPMDVVEAKVGTSVYEQPSTTSARIGVLGAGARAAFSETREAGDGCARSWRHLEPRGWACDATLAITSEAPTASTAVALDDDSEPSLSTYGAVKRGATVYATRDDVEAGEGRTVDSSMSVRAAGVTAVGGERYWVTGAGYIAASSIYTMAPSHFHGVRIADGAVRVAWAHGKDAAKGVVTMRSAPRADAEVTGELGARARVVVKEVSADGAFVRISDSDWVPRGELRMATAAEVPDGVGAHDRWLDIDLDEQVLVAYEGSVPVYATLVSSGKWDRPTPAETAHLVSKLRSADMTSTKVDVYSVADVPWTMFFDGNYALHTSYWHDGFGDVRSHGCINLAPRDARILYDWSSPDVPPGWTAVFHSETAAGSVVRTRHSRHS